MITRTMASASAASTTPTFSVPCFVRGYHVYQRIWSPTVGDILITAREPDNAHDEYTVAVSNDTHCMVGHVPQKISCSECFYFIKMGGTIAVKVTGKREHWLKVDWTFHAC